MKRNRTLVVLLALALLTGCAGEKKEAKGSAPTASAQETPAYGDALVEA